jgi:hypothetical protein
MLYMTDYSAKGVLRGVVRDATKQIPSYENLLNKASVRFEEITRKRGKPKHYMIKMHAFFAPYSLINVSHSTGTKAQLGSWIPYFVEDDYGWTLQCRFITANFNFPNSTGSFTGTGILCDNVDTDSTISFSGHALERLFQRSLKLNWNLVRKEIIHSMKYIMLWMVDYPRQPVRIVLPANNGYFVGSIDFEGGQRRIKIRTYIDKSDKLEKLCSQMNEIVVERNLDMVAAIKAMQFALDENPWVFERG